VLLIAKAGPGKFSFHEGVYGYVSTTRSLNCELDAVAEEGDAQKTHLLAGECTSFGAVLGRDFRIRLASAGI